ncbi:hypothetical protein NQ317_002712 [Molorchus minor]|uniref:Uncharacterized protein n=1 Tax=Molorchus minor TaxID=1323400 RepID=A0ABQ9K2L5_9CUCU|nr:hypothetical protein NQ317_002712 [Molorchus minor]
MNVPVRYDIEFTIFLRKKYHLHLYCIYVLYYSEFKYFLLHCYTIENVGNIKNVVLALMFQVILGVSIKFVLEFFLHRMLYTGCFLTLLTNKGGESSPNCGIKVFFINVLSLTHFRSLSINQINLNHFLIELCHYEEYIQKSLEYCLSLINKKKKPTVILTHEAISENLYTTFTS